MDGRGSFQTRSSDARIEYGGNVAMVSGRSVLYGYHGEFYKDLQTGQVGQANQFMHFDASGLFIGQFGQPSTRTASADLAGLSGNAFSPTLVRDAKDYFANIQTKTIKYHPLMAASDQPAIWLNAEKMARYREQMRPYYYDSARFSTYLEQLGIKYPTVTPVVVP